MLKTDICSFLYQI